MEFSFKDIIRIIKKNLFFIIAVSLIFSLCAFLGTKFLVSKTYTATVKLYVSASYDSSSGYDSLQSYNYAEKLVSTYIQMLDTNNFYSDLSEELNKKYTPSQLKGMITFTGVEETEVFKADVVCENPTEAKKIADAVAVTAPKTITELLIHNAELKIVDEATIPTAPTSPNVSRNVMVAFLAGLILALIIAFVRDYFDVKIKYDEDMTTICNVPVLSAIPDFEYFSNRKKPVSE